mmetsp:Transcript_41311/g.76346  ORF Transcript_41311/g.76346 Transcript_41311/m.76346 type:complete len:81 (-) Transcript_41311:35-277(-)
MRRGVKAPFRVQPSEPPFERGLRRKEAPVRLGKEKDGRSVPVVAVIQYSEKETLISTRHSSSGPTRSATGTGKEDVGEDD